MNLLKNLETEADKLHNENFSNSDKFRTVNNSFVEGFNYALAIVQGFEVELNGNQQVVLEWLKVQGKRRPIMTIADFADAYYGLEGAPTVPLEILSSYEQLSDSETYQVLAAFAEWGKKEVAE